MFGMRKVVLLYVLSAALIGFNPRSALYASGVSTVAPAQGGGALAEDFVRGVAVDGDWLLIDTQVGLASMDSRTGDVFLHGARVAVHAGNVVEFAERHDLHRVIDSGTPPEEIPAWLAALWPWSPVIVFAILVVIAIITSISTPPNPGPGATSSGLGLHAVRF